MSGNGDHPTEMGPLDFVPSAPCRCLTREGAGSWECFQVMGEAGKERGHLTCERWLREVEQPPASGSRAATALKRILITDFIALSSRRPEERIRSHPFCSRSVDSTAGCVWRGTGCGSLQAQAPSVSIVPTLAACSWSPAQCGGRSWPGDLLNQFLASAWFLLSAASFSQR